MKSRVTILTSLLVIALTVGIALSRRPATPKVETTSSAPPASCKLNECPFDIYQSDRGKTFAYTLTSRFTVHLDPNVYPKAELACQPQGIIGYISNEPPPEPPLYSARFEAAAPGSCTLSDRDWQVTIVVNGQ